VATRMIARQGSANANANANGLSSSSVASTLDTFLFDRILAKLSAHPEVSSILRELESTHSTGSLSASASVSSTMSRLMQVMERTIFSNQVTDAQKRRESDTSLMHRSQPTDSIRPYLNSLAHQAFNFVKHAPSPADQRSSALSASTTCSLFGHVRHPLEWVGPAGRTSRGSAPLLDSRLDRVISSACESFVLAAQNSQIQESNRLLQRRNEANEERASQTVKGQLSKEGKASGTELAASSSAKAISISSDSDTDSSVSITLVPAVAAALNAAHSTAPPSSTTSHSQPSSSHSQQSSAQLRSSVKHPHPHAGKRRHRSARPISDEETDEESDGNDNDDDVDQSDAIAPTRRSKRPRRARLIEDAADDTMISDTDADEDSDDESTGVKMEETEATLAHDASTPSINNSPELRIKLILPRSARTVTAPSSSSPSSDAPTSTCTASTFHALNGAEVCP